MAEHTIGSLIHAHLQESARVKERTAEACTRDIEAAVAMVASSFSTGGKLLLCGNGGSAGDCQHIAAEFTSVLRQDFPRPGLPAIALTTDTSFLTARGNDYGFDGIFARLVEALGKGGDVLIGISTSGNSKNVCAAMQAARDRGMGTIVLTGEGGGQLAGLSEVVIQVPSRKVQHIQEAHIAIGHILCQAVEEQLFPGANSQ
jgi:D-sedoheptulose 7-phosphate isomerase